MSWADLEQLPHYPWSTNELLNDLIDSTETFEAFLMSLTDWQLESTPPDGKRSVSQIIDHMVRLERVIIPLLLTPGEILSRDENKLMGKISDFLGNDDHPIKAISESLPQPLDSDIHDRIQDRLHQRDQIAALIWHINLRETLSQEDHPDLGKLSKAERIRYVIEHSLRHLRQIESRIKNPDGESDTTPDHL